MIHKHLVILLLCAFVLAGCQSAARFSSSAAPGYAASKEDSRTSAEPSTEEAVTSGLHDEELHPSVQLATTWLGTKYRYGGNDKAGVDCSGLVCSVWQELGKKLPRTTAEQIKIGIPVPIDKLQSGDLLFFNTSGEGVSHVGIYAANGLFIHTSTQRGVEWRSLSHPYYARRYLGARRVIQ